MALETLLDVKEIGNNAVAHLIDETTDRTGFSEKHIFIDHKQNIIAFAIQKGPIKEVGVNGCQIDAMVETLCLIVNKFNQSHPCEENEFVIEHLEKALLMLRARRQNREQRGVEGTSQV